MACIKIILSPTTYVDVILEHPWTCYLCNGATNIERFGETNGLYQIQCNWPDKEKEFLTSSLKIGATFLPISTNEYKIHLVVLSAFDGIAGGKIFILLSNMNLQSL